MKKCFKCKKIKTLEQFYKHRGMGDGHLNKCKTCAKKDVRRRYYDPETRPKIKEYERKRFQTAHRKTKVAEYQRARRASKPGKNRARQLAGKLDKQPCEQCGEIRAEAHHSDYRRPLAVRWLCFTHHREAHGQLID